MRWLMKACIQKIVSSLPGSASINYALRRYASRSLPVSSDTLQEMLFIAKKHYGFFLDHSPPGSQADPFFFEFGAGWDLISQLYYHAQGVKKQLAADIKPHAKLVLINDALKRAQQHMEKTGSAGGKKTVPPLLASMAELDVVLGIKYLAPCDVRKTDFPSACFDFVSTTATLEHIPAEDLAPILSECRRLLKPNCCLSCLIDLKDHYSYADHHISMYNFLKFSDRQWAFCNSSLHFQNRLRYSEYVALFQNAGFKILVCQAEQPTDSDIACLQSLRLDNKFAGSPGQLGVKTLWLVARKQ